MLQKNGYLTVTERAADLSQLQGEQFQCGDLGQDGLRRGHADFETGSGVEHGVGFAGH